MAHLWSLLFAIIVISHETSGSYDQDCYKDYPIKDGLICYPRCKSGYANYGQGPVCWAKCPSQTKNIGISCAKDSYGRSAGKPLSTCRSGYEKNGLLCYPNCKSGYYGVGPVCWQRCKSGYVDDGALCRQALHVYSRNTKGCPWYDLCGLIWGKCGEDCKPGYKYDGCTCRRPLIVVAKKSYGRGAGVPMSCKSSEEQNGALCYPRCRSGYKGVGPVCWAQCNGETYDTGTFCQKRTYGRGAGKALSCLNLSRDKLKGIDVSSITNFMKRVKGKTLTKGACLGLWAASKQTMDVLRMFMPCVKGSSWTTMVFSFTGHASALLSADAEIGIAVDLKQNKAVCYKSLCTGFHLDASVGLNINYGWFRSVDDIPGKSNVVFASAEIPGTEIGLSFAAVTNTDGEFIGALASVGLGVGLSPLPFDVGGSTCNAPKEGVIPFTP